MRYSIPASFRDVERAALSTEMLAQIRLSVMLGIGFTLSLVMTGGLSSLAAFVIGLLARARINASGGRLVGARVAWWCIIAGACGAVLATLALSENFHAVFNSLKR